MNLSFSAQELEFRNRVRDFLGAHLPPELRNRTNPGHDFDQALIRRWQRILFEHGWGAIHWPREFGGLGATPVEQYLFQLECALADAPVQPSFGLRMLAPVLMRFGSPEQQQRFLPKILSGEHWWCQGYSEPGAGSDLASLKTAAVRDGDQYVVTGQKCWTTLGQHADWMFCLVRTDPAVKRQQGISLVLIDMRSPGITVRSTQLADGTVEVNEVWLDGVRVPLADRVGEENAGWTYAKFLLGHERVNIAGVGACIRDFERLKAAAREPDAAGRCPIDDPGLRQKIARVGIDLLALEYTNLRMLAATDASAIATQASLLKVRGSEIRQAISELLLQVFGVRALPYRTAPGAEPLTDATAAYLCLRRLSIFGGTNEIQKNIVAQSLLEL